MGKRVVGHISSILLILLHNFAMGAVDDTPSLAVALANVRAACSGISDEMSDLKKMAGINTAVTAVGTVSGGVALGTGVAKASVDNKAEKVEAELAEELAELQRLAAEQTSFDRVPDLDVLRAFFVSDISDEDVARDETDSGAADQLAKITAKQAELDALTKKSERLGNIRTGTMAGAAVADTAGAIIAATNQVKGDLQSQINDCRAATQELSTARMRAVVAGTADSATLSKAENIIRECSAWELVDLSKINKRGTGAAITAGTGAAMAIAGTVTSAKANSSSVRDDNAESGKKKEKNLNTASNVLAGGTTAASAVATVFNATQISAIKRAVTVADACEGALK